MAETVYYVDPDMADDSGNGLTPETAKKTEAAASALAVSGDTIRLKATTFNAGNQGSGFHFTLAAKTLTYEPYGGDRITVVTDYSYAVSVATGVVDASKIVTFKNCDFVFTGDRALYTLSPNKHISVVFDNCTADDTNGTKNYIVYTGASDSVNSKLRFINGCVLTCRGYFYLNDLDTFEISDSTITKVGAGSTDLIPVFKTINNIIFEGNTVSCPAGGVFTMMDANGYLGTTNMRLANNTVSSSKSFLRYDTSKVCENGLIKNNVLTSTTSAGHSVISLGTEYQSFTGWAVSTGYSAGDLRSNKGIVVECIQNHTSAATDEPNSGVNWQQYWKIIDIGKFIIEGNIIDSSALTTAGHAILIGPGCRNSNIENNTISVGTGALAYGIVCKGWENTIRKNKVKGPQPLYVWSGCRNIIENNTLIPSSGNAILLNGITGQYPCGTVIRNNIFDARSASLAVLCEVGDGYYLTLYVEGNCYVAGSAGLIKINNTTYTLDTVKAMWQSAETCHTDNDSNSIVADPMLDTQYRTHNPYFLDKDFGAWQPTFPTSAVGARALRNRQRVSLTEVGL
jgi:hypothetical protein